MSEGNGKPIPDVSPEQVKANKFAKDPSQFIDIDDIVMAVVRQPSGTLSTLHGACQRVEMELSLTRLTYKTMQIFQTMDMQNAMKAVEKDKKIITGLDMRNPFTRAKR